MAPWLCTAALTLAAATAAAQCVPKAAESAAIETRQQQSELLKIKVQEMSTDVPQAAQKPIHDLKEALTSAVDAEIGCVPINTDGATIERSLAKLLDANAPEKPFTPSKADSTGLHEEDNVYGGNLKVRVSTPGNAPQLRAVELSFTVACGDDTMLLIYQPGAAGWHRLLRWQSGDYKEISGAFGGFFLYAVIPGKDAAGLRIAVAHGTDWCTSRWSGFDVDVVAPIADAVSPRVVWHQRQGYVRESGPRMTAKPDGFELRLDVGTIESDVMVRKGVFHYKVTGDTVERIAPIAADGRGFVDEWLQSPWTDAKTRSTPAGLATFEKAHEAFTRTRKDASVLYSYGPVRSCLTKGHYQVQIDAEPGGPQFYTIEEGPTGYIMTNYSTAQDERCSGPDLMKKP